MQIIDPKRKITDPIHTKMKSGNGNLVISLSILG
jgi:hypothetical protein